MGRKQRKSKIQSQVLHLIIMVYEINIQGGCMEESVLYQMEFKSGFVFV